MGYKMKALIKFLKSLIGIFDEDIDPDLVEFRKRCKELEKDDLQGPDRT